MPYVVLTMEALAVLWFVIMAAHVTGLHKWSMTITPAKLDDVGRSMQQSAKWAFPTGLMILAVLTIVEAIRHLPA